MTGAAWATWLGGAAAGLAVLGFLWRKVVIPLAHGFHRLGELMDRLFEVLDGWPQIQASVLATEGELTALAIQTGELAGRISHTRTDVDNAFERIRDLETARHTHPRKGHHDH